MRERTTEIPFEARAMNLIDSLDKRKVSCLAGIPDLLSERARQFDNDPGVSNEWNSSLQGVLASDEVKEAFAGTLNFTLRDASGSATNAKSKVSTVTKKLFQDPSAILFAPNKLSAQEFNISTMEDDLKGVSEPTRNLILLIAFSNQAFVRLKDRLEPLIIGEKKDGIKFDHRTITNPEEFWHLKLVGARNKLNITSPGIEVCRGFIDRINPIIDEKAKELFGERATDAVQTLHRALELDEYEKSDKEKPTRHSMFLGVDQIINPDRIPVTEETKTAFGTIVRDLLKKFGKPEDRDKIAKFDDGKIIIAEPLDPEDPIYELDVSFHETDEVGNYIERKYELGRDGNIEFSVHIEPPQTEEKKRNLKEFKEITKKMSPQKVAEYLHNQIKAIEDELSPGEIDWENSEVVRVLRREARAVQDERIAGLRIVTEGELIRVIEALKIAKPVI